MDNDLGYVEKRALLYELEEIAERYGLRQFNKVEYDALVASVLTKEPIVTKGNLTAGSNKVTIGGTGTASVIGAGVSVDVAQANLDHGSIGGLADDDHTQYLRADATRALSADWDAGNGRMIQTDKIRARDGDGLALYEDGGSGIFVADGGNVGVGIVDIESWASTQVGLQVGGNSAIMATKASSAGGGLYFLQNAYYDGAWKYTLTDEASIYTQASGEHILRVAASGTKDSTITWIVGINVGVTGGVHIGNYSDPGLGNLYADGNVSALTFTDRTESFEGDAVKAICGITSKDGLIDHASMPEFMRSTIRLKEKGLDDVIETGRDLGATISVLLEAIKQQQAMIEELQRKIL